VVKRFLFLMKEQITGKNRHADAGKVSQQSAG